VCVHLTLVCVNPTQACVNPTQALVCTPAAYDRLLPRLAVWGAAAELHCCTEEELLDPDRQEHFKTRAFVALMAGVRKVGLALTPRCDANGALAPGDAMEAERWPLVQAYGLEGVGRPGFFTMTAAVTDVYAALQAAYVVLDAAAVRAACERSLPMFLHHWAEFVGVFSRKEAGDRLLLTERLAGEPLLSFFAYGTLRPALGVQAAVTMAPRVVFGVNTNSDQAAPSATRLGEAGAGRTPAVHMVVEAADPKGALRVARTYFLSHGVLPPTAALGAAAAQLDDAAAQAARGWSDTATDTRVLMLLYACLVDAAAAATKHFCATPAADARCVLTLPRCVLTLPRCVLTLPRCVLTLPRCVLTLPRCVLTLPRCVLTLPRCVLTLPRCVLTLPRCVLTLPRCVLTLPRCVLTLPRSARAAAAAVLASAAAARGCGGALLGQVS
jgi:hypothetical protein